MAQNHLAYAIEEAVREHRALAKLSSHMLAILALNTPDTAGVVMLRWRIGKQFIAHLARADREIYAPILQSGDRTLIAAADRTRADRMCAELGYRAYMVEWPLQRINAEWAGFAAATRAMLATMTRLMGDEADTLFCRIARLDVPHAA